MKYLFAVLVVLLGGCALIESDAGKAHYKMEPVTDGNGALVCCSIEIKNAKDVGQVIASVEIGPDGTVTVLLQEDGVSATGPLQVIAEQNGKLIDMVTGVVP